MDTELLRTFVAVTECGGFSAAAAILHRSQSAVSLQIQRLEEQLGQKLFERHSGSIALTPAGGRLLPYARRILSLQEEVRSRLTDDERGERIRLGISEEHASAHLPRLLPEFAALHGHVQLEITCNITSALVTAFQEGLLDLVLGVRHEPTPTGRLLGREPLVWVIRDGHSPANWDTLPLALNPEGCIFRAHALAALGQHERRWETHYVSRSPTGINVAVQAGLALTVKTPRSVPPGCRIVTPDEGLPELGHVEIELHRAPSSMSEAFDSFCELLESVVLSSHALADGAHHGDA